MIKHFIWQWRVNQTLKFNRHLYWLQKIPLIGRLISSKWYKSQRTKKSVQIIAALTNFVFGIIGKVSYYFILFAAASFILEMSNGETVASYSQSLQSYLFLLLLVSGLLGSMMNILPMAREDQLEVIFIKIFRIEPYTYYRTKYTREALVYLFFDGMVAAGVFAWRGLPPLQALCFITLVAGLRYLLSVVGFWLYRPHAKRPEAIGSSLLIAACFLTGIGGALFFINSWQLKLDIRLFFDWRALMLGIIFSLIALYLWQSSHQRINRIAYHLISFQTLKTMQVDTENLNRKEVELDQADIHLNSDKAKNKLHKEYSGIRYLNELFFERLGHLFRRQIRNRLLILIAIFVVASVAATYFKPHLIDENGDSPLVVMPFVSVIMCYGFNIGEYFTKFCFYNLDRQLLRYRFYREPTIVLESIKIRFWKNFSYNLPLLFAMMIGSTLLFLVIDREGWPMLMLTWVTQIVAMLLFSMHFLIMYYTLQPFTESMQTKSPAYTIINMAIYALVFFSANLFSDENFLWYPVMIIVLAIIYLPIGLYLVVRLAPKQFKRR